ncbi:MAG: hypothetical protein J5507_06305 [Clostridia bacterium]|nr:hypothetical protein [Clostridia bacterium]
MKAYKILTIITIIILISIITAACFMGIYKLKDYRVKNVVPNYLFGKEFSKSRTVNLEVDTSTETTKIYDKDGNEITEKEDGIEYTEENGYTIVETKANPEDVLNKENFKEAKKIIKRRLKGLKIEQYTIDLNEETGAIDLDITEDDETDRILSLIPSTGIFEVKDSETGEVLLDNSMVKSTGVVYGQTNSSNTTVYLKIQFNKEGTKKLEEISKIYVETTVQKTNENGETEDATESKDVSIYLNGEEIRTTHFGDTLNNGVLNVPIGSASDNSSLQQYITSAKEMSVIINSGKMPIVYNQTDSVKDNSINIFENKIVVYSLAAIAILAAIYLIIRLKLKGILAIILEIGYISLLLLTLRYTNVKIAIGGIIGIAISIILSYIYIYFAFKNTESNFIKEVTAKYALRIIPFYIIAIVFSFIRILQLSSLGMSLFWGIIIMYIYNLVLTRITINTIKN